MGVGEGGDPAGEAFGLGVVLPCDGDGGLLEGWGELLDEVGVVHGDVSPEEELAVEGLEVGDDLLEEVEVDGAEALGVYGGFGLTFAEVYGLVGTDVEEGAGVDGGELGEHGVGELEGLGLGGGEDVSVRGFGDGGVLLPVEKIVEVAEGFLLGEDGDVVGGGVGDEFAGLGLGECAAGGRHEGDAGVLHGVFEVGGVDVDFVGGEGADDFFLEFEGGDGAAGEVVGETTVGQSGPVADGGGVEDGGGAGAFDELLDGLEGVEDTGGGDGSEGDAFTVGDDAVALGLEFGWRGGWGGGCGGEGFGVDGVGEGSAEAGDEDMDGCGGIDDDATGGEGGFEVFDGEEIFGSAGCGAGDVDAGGEGLGSDGVEFPGDGDELQGLGGGRGEGGGEEKQQEAGTGERHGDNGI